MTPKEKAKDLFNKYYLFIDIKNYENTKACALIAVDELINFNTGYSHITGFGMMPHNAYWQEVKQEIEAL
jgi:predicted membrane protein